MIIVVIVSISEFSGCYQLSAIQNSIVKPKLKDKDSSKTNSCHCTLIEFSLVRVVNFDNYCQCEQCY